MSRAQRIVLPAYAKCMHEKGIRPGGVDLPAWSPSAALGFMDGHGIRTGILSPTFTADFLLDTTRTAISLILSGAMARPEAPGTRATRRAAPVLSRRRVSFPASRADSAA